MTGTRVLADLAQIRTKQQLPRPILLSSYKQRLSWFDMLRLRLRVHMSWNDGNIVLVAPLPHIDVIITVNLVLSNSWSSCLWASSSSSPSWASSSESSWESSSAQASSPLWFQTTSIHWALSLGSGFLSSGSRILSHAVVPLWSPTISSSSFPCARSAV